MIAVKAYDFTSPFQQRMDYQGGTFVIYIGYATPGVATSYAGWQIRKFTYDVNNNVTQIQFSSSDVGFNSIWDNRATYSYG